MNVTIALSRPVVIENQTESDSSLLEAARAMNKEALVKIFDRYSPALYNYAFRLCEDPQMADYIVGDVFAKLLDQFSAGRGPSTNLRSYLYEMAYHLVVDESRHATREAPLDVVDAPGYESYTTATWENELMFKTILLAIRNNLTPDQRHVVILRFLEGFNLRETAAIVKKDVNHVKVIQNRAINALRKALNDHLTT